MKSTHLVFTLLLSLSFAACGGASKDGAKAGIDTTNNGGGRTPRDPNMVEQLPAQEILGCKVERHLRYQPEDEVSGYVEKLSDVDAFLFNASSAIRHEVGKLVPEAPGYGTVVVAINAQGQHRIWYVFPEGQPTANLKAAFQAAISETPPLVVKHELVVVGFALSLWGYKETPQQQAAVDLPKEWNDANKGFSSPQKATKLAQITWDDAGV